MHVSSSHRLTMSGYSSDSHDERLVGGLLGGGKFADVLLWRSKWLSGWILAGVTAVWLLFEVFEFNLLTLLCNLSITAMLIVFIWCNGAALLGRESPEIPDKIVSREAFEEATLSFHSNLNRLFRFLQRMVCGENLKLFLIIILSLWLISVIGSCTSFVNLLYFGILGILTLPFLYLKCEDDVHRLFNKGGQSLKEVYEKFDSKVLHSIPRGPNVPSKEMFK